MQVSRKYHGFIYVVDEGIENSVRETEVKEQRNENG